MSLLPAAVFGLEVRCGLDVTPAIAQLPAAFRITMAAIDPTEGPDLTVSSIDYPTPRATLKMIRKVGAPGMDGINDEDDDDSEDEDDLKALLNGDDDMGSSGDEEDEEVNGGPSDPSKSKKARQEAAIESLRTAFEAGNDDEDMMLGGLNGDSMSMNKGKGIANGLDMEDSDEDDDSDDEWDEFVICTLDTTHHYQMPIDITISEDEEIFFRVDGTHNIHLTGNYVLPWDQFRRRAMADHGDYDYDLSPDEDELDDDDEESDELDDIDDPRITELLSDDEDEEVPHLVTKGKNKRPASDSEEESVNLDDIMAKSLKSTDSVASDTKLSKKQKKKLKNNAGEPAKPESESASSKKVQFAKDLEQGPSGSKKSSDKAEKNDKSEKVDKTDKTDKTDKKETAGGDSKKGGLGVQMVKGVKVDVKKLGSGPAAKKGSKVSMRYIGKLKDGKQFDANKKGKPFIFKLGAGEVIAGWDIGVEGICAGGERRLTIPASLGYGKKGAPPTIPPNAELTFDIKCLEVN